MALLGLVPMLSPICLLPGHRRGGRLHHRKSHYWRALRLQPTGTISTVQLIGWFPVLFITFLASIYVLLKVPALTNHIFSGTSGGSSAGILEAPAAATAASKEF